jgi:hypothetical protein
VRNAGLGEFLIAFLVLGGLGCLVSTAFVPSAVASNVLTIVAVALAGLGVVVYLIHGWSSGAMGTWRPPPAPMRLDDGRDFVPKTTHDDDEPS